jgi:hypothetical protein
MRIIRIVLNLPLLAASAVLASPAAGQAAVSEYTANYAVEYKGRHVARAEFSVSADGGGQYLFRSSTEARGLYRLASPKPAVESSRFSLADGEVRPLHFEFEDGSRKGEDNYSIGFDRGQGRVRVTASGETLDLPLEADLLDRGSLQVALMRDLARCRQPGPYRFVDEDGIRSYHYEQLEDLTAETGAGPYAAVRFAQRREGSSRSTVLWFARDLDYLPVRIEQFRDGELETVFSLESVDGIDSRSSSCAAFS